VRAADGCVVHVGIFAATPYCIDLMGGPYVETDEAVIKAWRPKHAIRPKQD
jgi:molybdopterin adenylyltransferase